MPQNKELIDRGYDSMRRVATSWKVIDEILKENAHSAYQSLRAPARVSEIRKLEKLIGMKLPTALVSSLRIHDGMQSRVNLVAYESLLSVTEIIKEWQITMDNPWDDPGTRLVDGKRIKGDLRWRPVWVPIAVDAGGDLLGVDLDPGPAGTLSQVFTWQNYGEPEPKVVAATYAAWLDQIAEELIHRRFTLNKWGVIQLSKRLT